jgi:hypothetical protein
VDLGVLLTHCAGRDLHQKETVVCVLTGNDGQMLFLKKKIKIAF